MPKRPKSGMTLAVMRRIARAGKAIPMTVLLLTEIFVVNSVASIGEKLENEKSSKKEILASFC